MSDPLQIRNIGKVSRSWLAEAGIVTLEDLRAQGSVSTFRIIKSQQPRASLNLLWALEGAVQNMDWRDLTEEHKRRLRKELVLKQLQLVPR